MTNQSYSYSKISKFNQCPRAFYHQYIVKDVEYKSSPEAAYGSEMHDFIDTYMKGSAKITQRTEFLKPLLEQLSNIEGEIHTEYGIGFNYDRSETTFEDKQAFVKGKSDCTIFHPTEPKVKIFDWKFSNKTDPSSYKLEMDMFAMLHFWKHPEIIEINTGLVWLKKRAPTSYKLYRRSDLPEIESSILANIERIEDAISFENYPCKPSGLCFGWCAATKCPNWKPKKEK